MCLSVTLRLLSLCISRRIPKHPLWFFSHFSVMKEEEYQKRIHLYKDVVDEDEESTHHLHGHTPEHNNSVRG